MTTTQLHEMALDQYQNNLAIIQRLFLIKAMTQDQYQESMEQARRVWEASQSQINRFDTRISILNTNKETMQ